MDLEKLLVDLDGTLYVGDEPVAGAREALIRLGSAGLAIRYLTNTTREPRRKVCARLWDLGFEVEETEIFTPARATATMLRGSSCFALVNESLVEDLRDATLTEQSPDFVVVIGDLGDGFSYARLDAALRCLMEGAELLALQKNRYWQKEDGLHLDKGPFVAALEYASGKRAKVVGKPERNFLELALQEMELEAHRVAMVGDDAEADVAGVKSAGLAGILIKTGKYRPGDEEAGNADLMLGSIAELPEALGL